MPEICTGHVFYVYVASVLFPLVFVIVVIDLLLGLSTVFFSALVSRLH